VVAVGGVVGFGETGGELVGTAVAGTAIVGAGVVGAAVSVVPDTAGATLDEANTPVVGVAVARAGVGGAGVAVPVLAAAVVVLLVDVGVSVARTADPLAGARLRPPVRVASAVPSPDEPHAAHTTSVMTTRTGTNARARFIPAFMNPIPTASLRLASSTPRFQ
jgi:hypothetical protein